MKRHVIIMLLMVAFLVACTQQAPPIAKPVPQPAVPEPTLTEENKVAAEARPDVKVPDSATLKLFERNSQEL
jgi:uncharacterized lipoprotein YbaY